jgi:glycerol-3-phosphate acyltransferase PlsY
MNPIFLYIISLFAGYLSGSIMFANIFTKIISGKDIRSLGNNNPGAANTFRTISPFWGIMVGVLDGLKSFIPMLAGYSLFHLSSINTGLIGIGSIIGHCYPIYFNFKGGRAASTILGVYLFFIPFELIAAYIVSPIIVFLIIRKNHSYWIPFGVISLGGVACLFFHHSLEIKIIILVSALTGLFFNRFYLPIVMNQLFQKDK